MWNLNNSKQLFNSGVLVSLSADTDGLRRIKFSIYLPDETGRFLPKLGSGQHAGGSG